jgi:hypothetical protein
MSSIKVTNNSGATIEVAINHWGKGGETTLSGESQSII